MIAIQAKAERRRNGDHFPAPIRLGWRRQWARSNGGFVPLPLDRILQHERRDEKRHQNHAPGIPESGIGVAGLGDDEARDQRQETAEIAGAEVIGDRQRRIADVRRSEEHTSELQSLMRISYAVFCLKKKIEEKST